MILYTLSKARSDTEPTQVPAHQKKKQPEREGAQKGTLLPQITFA
jgi:hypothetical protein